MSDELIAVVADDLTGAADTGVQLARAGYRTAVVFRGESPPPEDLDAVVFDTDSRTTTAGDAARRVAEAMREARDARLVYKKIDSTLRGRVAEELSAALAASGRRRGILAPAFPAAGRTTVGGTQRVHGVPVHETEMRNDTRNPVREGHVPTLLGKLSRSVGTLGVEDLADPGIVGRALGRDEWTVADAERDEDLEGLVRAVPHPERVLWAGSAGLASALGTVHPGPHAGRATSPLPSVRSVLVVVGSLNAVSREQLRALADEYGRVTVPVEAGPASAVREAEAKARDVFSGGACAVLHSTGSRGGSRGRVTSVLAGVAAGLGRGGLFDALVMTGGSTAVAVSRRLGASGIRLEDEVEAGIPVGTLAGPDPYTVVTKSGGFGGPGTLVEAVEFLLGGKERA